MKHYDYDYRKEDARQVLDSVRTAAGFAFGLLLCSTLLFLSASHLPDVAQVFFYSAASIAVLLAIACIVFMFFEELPKTTEELAEEARERHVKALQKRNEAEIEVTDTEDEWTRLGGPGRPQAGCERGVAGEQDEPR